MKRILSLLSVIALLLTQNIAFAAPAGAQVLSIAVNTPQIMRAGTTVTPDTRNVPFARLNIRTAANSGSIVNKIGLHIIGTSAASTALSNIKLVDLQGRVVGSVASPFANGTIVIFTNGFAVNANSLAQLDVVADVTMQARVGTLGVALDSMDTTNLVNAKKIAVFPTPAAIKQGTLATVVVGPQLTATVSPALLPAQTARMGEQHVLVGTVQISVGAEDILLNELTLTSSTNILSNITIVKTSNGQLIDRAAAFDANNRAQFPRLVQLLGRNTTTTYAIYADIAPANQAISPGLFTVGIQNSADIVAWGAFSAQAVNVRGIFPLWSRAVQILQ